MEEIIEEVTKLFAQAFPGSSTELEPNPGGEKAGGYLIWEGFDGVEPLDRQRHLSRVLREKLGDNFRTKVTTILAVTPWEVAVMRS